MPHNHLTSSGNAAWHQMEPQLHARQAGPASAAPTSSSSATCRWIDRRKWIKLWTYPPANKPHSSALATHILPSAILQGILPPVPQHRHTQRNRGAYLEAPPLSLHSWAQASPLPSAEQSLQHSGYPGLQSRPCPPPPRQQPWCLAPRDLSQGLLTGQMGKSPISPFIFWEQKSRMSIYGHLNFHMPKNTLTEGIFSQV